MALCLAWYLYFILCCFHLVRQRWNRHITHYYAWCRRRCSQEQRFRIHQFRYSRTSSCCCRALQQQGNLRWIFCIQSYLSHPIISSMFTFRSTKGRFCLLSVKWHRPIDATCWLVKLKIVVRNSKSEPRYGGGSFWFIMMVWFYFFCLNFWFGRFWPFSNYSF